jgi:hypothetical protein
MGWNYRVMKHIKGDGAPPHGETFYAIHEVYYNDDGTVRGWTEKKVSPCGETPKEFLGSLMLYQGAVIKPVLVVRNGRTTGEEAPIKAR